MFPQLLTLLPIFVFLRDVQCFVNTKFGLPSLVVPIPCQADVLYEQFNYICVKNQIVCLPGWTNPENYCRDPACPEGCDENHGSCTKPNVCHCRAGYFGHACQNCVPLPGCIQGTCKQAYECNCNEGWQGVFCSEAICKEGCHPNSGFCDLPGQCECHIGWQSENCTDCAVLPGCIHGYCNRPLECICEEGWTGEFCDTPICKEKCHPAYGSCDVSDMNTFVFDSFLERVFVAVATKASCAMNAALIRVVSMERAVSRGLATVSQVGKEHNAIFPDKRDVSSHQEITRTSIMAEATISTKGDVNRVEENLALEGHIKLKLTITI
ncbi:hypothetical protein TCAL_12700 [Tigriopus californicus]|uniref:EGF-like domain-containing protein n=1 Tax=Tigriopus californicus TaxID=6832 RepID=A0A553P2A7_TIGCA|nr:hypothetical protein TCAL_12700 [Tigriopus californicus]